jgi:hypothetical protein
MAHARRKKEADRRPQSSGGGAVMKNGDKISILATPRPKSARYWKTFLTHWKTFISRV